MCSWEMHCITTCMNATSINTSAHNPDSQLVQKPPHRSKEPCVWSPGWNRSKRHQPPSYSLPELLLKLLPPLLLRHDYDVCVACCLQCENASMQESSGNQMVLAALNMLISPAPKAKVRPHCERHTKSHRMELMLILFHLNGRKQQPPNPLLPCRRYTKSLTSQALRPYIRDLSVSNDWTWSVVRRFASSAKAWNGGTSSVSAANKASAGSTLAELLASGMLLSNNLGHPGSLLLAVRTSIGSCMALQD